MERRYQVQPPGSAGGGGGDPLVQAPATRLIQGQYVFRAGDCCAEVAIRSGRSLARGAQKKAPREPPGQNEERCIHWVTEWRGKGFTPEEWHRNGRGRGPKESRRERWIAYLVRPVSPSSSISSMAICQEGPAFAQSAPRWPPEGGRTATGGIAPRLRRAGTQHIIWLDESMYSVYVPTPLSSVSTCSPRAPQALKVILFRHLSL